MRKLIALLVTALAVSAPFSTAMAAGGREDDSSLVVWIFFGFCALILVAQLLPAILNMKKVARQEEERHAVESAVKVQVDK